MGKEIKKEKQKSDCHHEFTISQIATESDCENPLWHRVVYIICPKCGLVKRQNI